MKKIFSFSLTCLCTLGLSNSMLAQNTINVAGNSANINGMTFAYSIGEMTLISTEKAGNIIVTQGLLQPSTGVSNTDENSTASTLGSMADKLKVYPNPTDNVLFIETTEAIEGDFNYQLFDAAGKIVINEQAKQISGSNKFSLNLKSFAAGSYYLLIKKTAADGTMENLSYKIQKTN